MTAGRKVNTKSVHWCTPPKFVEPITNFYGGSIDLDPCSNDQSRVNARVNLKEGGLEHDWSNYQSIYANPPYGRNGKTSIYDWLEKCHKTRHEVIAMIPVATNTKHWKEFVFNSDIICFLHDTRLKFLIDGSTNNKGASMICCLVYWGLRETEFMNYLGDKPRGFLHQRTNLLTLTPSILLNALKKVEVVFSVSVNSLRPTGICFKPSVSIFLAAWMSLSKLYPQLQL